MLVVVQLSGPLVRFFCLSFIESKTSTRAGNGLPVLASLPFLPNQRSDVASEFFCSILWTPHQLCLQITARRDHFLFLHVAPDR